VPAPALAQLIARGASRYFRQNGHALVTAARWVERGTPAVRVAHALATDQALAEAVLRGAVAAGLEVRDIVPANPEDRGLSLLPSAERQRRARDAWRRVGRLAAVVAGLWIAAGTLQATRLSVAARRVDAELARLQAPREALLRARRSLDSAAAMIAALQQADARRGLVAERLGHVAQALPDSTVLVDLVIDQAGAVELSGRAAHALAVVHWLRRDTSLSHPRLHPETARDSALGVEWEHVVIHLGPDGAP
jgi:HPt (histidine-containing phosphotransfer) domain-containing protein